MGAADIVPGVSGGTVALILGVYQRLVTAISHVDGHFFGFVHRRQWRAAAEHLDLRFLMTLGFGIGMGIVGLASLMHTLLTEHREVTFAAFFGLIFASGILVGRMCRPRDQNQAGVCVVGGLLAAAFAFWLVSQAGIQNQPGLLYTFLCGSIGICAMILPGVSGSYLLLLLDKYEEITGIIKGLKDLETTSDEFLTLAVFACGCLVGLLVFSKVLRWLLAAHHAVTMAVLCGFMIGSLYKVWPFQTGDVGADASLKEQAMAMKPSLPPIVNSHVLACAVIGVVCFAGVLAVDAVARKSRND